MSTTVMTERFAEASSRLKARMAGVSSLLAILVGIHASLILHGRLSTVAELTAAACNIAMTLLLYDIFIPVNRTLSLLAAFFGLVVSTVGALEWTFLPRILGGLMAVAGLCYPINSFANLVSTPLQNYLYPYILFPSGVAEISLCLWFLVKGVNVERWNEQASEAGIRV